MRPCPICCCTQYPLPSREDTISISSFQFLFGAGLVRGLLSGGCLAAGVSLLFAQVAATTLGICFLHFVRALPCTHSFEKAHNRLGCKKGRGRLAFEHRHSDAVSPDQRQPEISSSFEKLQMGIPLRALKRSWKSAYMVAAHTSKPQSVHEGDWPEVRSLGLAQQRGALLTARCASLQIFVTRHLLMKLGTF